MIQDAHSMKLTLIMPGVGRKPGEKYAASWSMEPLGLAALAAVTPLDVEVVLADDRLEPIPYDEPTDAVGICLDTYAARRAYAIAAQYRARHVPVILGGYHPTLLPEEAVQYGDAIVEGEAEAVWPQVIADLRAGRLQPRYRASGPPPVDVLPDRRIFAGKKYMPLMLVETGRGCRFNCNFCSVSQFYHQTSSVRPLANVLAEIRTAGRRAVFFVDDNIVTDLQRTKQFCAAIRPAGIRWVSQGTVCMADDRELLALMRASGCCGVLIGFESLSTATLAAMGKSWNRAVRDYEEAIRRMRDAGLPIYATFVFGYDTDDADAFERTMEFAIRQKFYIAAFNHLVPFPGTPLYRQFQQAGRLRSVAWWLDDTFQFGDVAFQPLHMTAEELAARCYRARCDFYRLGSILRRAWDFRCNVRTPRTAARYFMLNLFSAREMRSRQGLPLGEGFDSRDPQPTEPTAPPRQEASA
jgi:radical SAM superfamily enzyme YgiQ (UPF0313 family)